MPHTEIIKAILEEHYDLSAEKIKFMRDGGSYSYAVFTPGQKLFLRLIRPPFTSTAHQALKVHSFLMDEGFPVPRIILTKTGATCVSTKIRSSPHIFVLYEFIEGEEANPRETAEEAGRLVARFHNLMEGYTGELPLRDKHFYIGRYVGIMKKKRYDERKIALFAQYGDTLWNRVKDLPKGPSHGDLYCANLHMAKDGKLYMLDFDTCCVGFPMNEAAFFCNSSDYFTLDEHAYERSRQVLRCFLKGYQPVRALGAEEIAAFPHLIAITHYQLQAQVMEVFGLDCVDHAFFDRQLDWLMNWEKQTTRSID